MQDNTFVTPEDVTIINRELMRGNDVRIQKTKTGYRIVSDTVHVVKKHPGGLRKECD